MEGPASEEKAFKYIQKVKQIIKEYNKNKQKLRLTPKQKKKLSAALQVTSGLQSNGTSKSVGTKKRKTIKSSPDSESTFKTVKRRPQLVIESSSESDLCFLSEPSELVSNIKSAKCSVKVKKEKKQQQCQFKIKQFFKQYLVDSQQQVYPDTFIEELCIRDSAVSPRTLLKLSRSNTVNSDNISSSMSTGYNPDEPPLYSWDTTEEEEIETVLIDSNDSDSDTKDDCIVVDDSSLERKSVIENVEPVDSGVKNKFQLDFGSSSCFSPTKKVKPSYNFTTAADSTNKVKYIDLKECKLVVMSGSNVKVSLHGLATVTVLHGKIEAFGSILDKNTDPVNIYSPRGTALMYFRNIGGAEYDSIQLDVPDQFREYIDNLDIYYNTSIVLCTKINQPSMMFLEKHISQQIFPKVEADSLQCIFEPKNRDPKSVWNIINISEEWDQVTNRINGSTRMLLCGGKGVGKSTSLRYAVNKLLQHYKQVHVIDLDPGQSEFTVPGCMSVVTVTKPLLGPNYTHVQNAEVSVLSDINAGHDPRKYLRAVKYLISKMIPTEETPTLVNYMGFNRGIGLNIISSVICIVQPTDLVMIQSEKPQNNFKYTLMPYVVKREAKLFCDEVNNVSYNLIIARSMSDDNDGWTMTPRLVREMCLFAYLGKMMNYDTNSLLSPDIPTYETDLATLKLVNTKGKEVSPMAVNANIVTLCSSFCDGEFTICGWGIVRGIDLQKNILILLTPLEADRLNEVYYLVAGNVSFPPSLVMTTDDVVGLVPYIHDGEIAGQFTKRSYLPRNKR